MKSMTLLCKAVNAPRLTRLSALTLACHLTQRLPARAPRHAAVTQFSTLSRATVFSGLLACLTLCGCATGGGPSAIGASSNMQQLIAAQQNTEARLQQALVQIQQLQTQLAASQAQIQANGSAAAMAAEQAANTQRKLGAMAQQAIFK